MIRSLLIANRGEIACRIIDTAKRLGIRTIAVYSDADRTARHVRLADHAVHIGPAPSLESYLNIPAVLDAAKQTDAEAIHPGYGFLSENPAFANACADAGIVFVGPTPDAMTSMADKSLAKQIMADAGVPTIPGFYSDQPNVDWQAEADRVGYPLLIKAVAGGGGRGMRLVHTQANFANAMAAARREAKNYFNDERVFLERYLTQPRHVEVQVFADQHGQTVHLSERDCSIQRRHQKVIEEAPAPNLSDDLRDAFGQTAVKACQAIHYVGAGTIEFLLDASGAFYFMEMNTRLQVEHPVTEMILGVDLVEWQLRIASGEALPLSQDQLNPHGHAMEVRLYAEDPDQDFMPSSGELIHCQFPDSENVRVDRGYDQGDTIPMHYDAMLAKLIVHADTRQACAERLVTALALTEIIGIKNNVDFLQRIVRSSAFQQAELSTAFLDQHADLLQSAKTLPDPLTILHGALALLEYQNTLSQAAMALSTDLFSPWQQQDHWRMNTPATRHLAFWWHEHPLHVELRDHHLHYQGVSLTIDTTDCPAAIIWRNELHLFGDQHTLFYIGQSESEQSHAHTSDGTVTSPMPGTVVQLFVSEGDRVAQGDRLLIIEAMKMEHTLFASAAGVVEGLSVQQGDTVNEGVALLTVQVG